MAGPHEHENREHDIQVRVQLLSPDAEQFKVKLPETAALLELLQRGAALAHVALLPTEDSPLDRLHNILKHDEVRPAIQDLDQARWHIRRHAVVNIWNLGSHAVGMCCGCCRAGTPSRGFELPFRRCGAELARKQGRDRMLMGVANHPRHTLESRNLLRRPLSVAARHQNSATPVAAQDSANYLSDLGVCGCGNRTRIEDGHVAVARAGGFFKATFEQLPLERGAVRLAGSTSEIGQIEAGHRLRLL